MIARNNYVTQKNHENHKDVPQKHHLMHKFVNKFVIKKSGDSASKKRNEEMKKRNSSFDIINSSEN